ncbi:MAG: glycosyltransferase [Planctomycetes bacterium]|nr:glycosyltransferase [Planctomycetota bacterium]
MPGLGSLASAAAGAALLFWVLLALDRRRSWPGEIVLAGQRPGAGAAGEGSGRGDEAVLVVVPARDEAEALRETLPALLSQSRSFSRLVLVDDRSADGTGSVARETAARCAEPDKVLVVAGEPPPGGWTGKLHALATGLRAGLEAARAGGQAEPAWILFTDADIRHPPGSLRALLSKAHAERRDLVSVMVRLRAETSWERLLVPPFVWFFQLLYPFRLVAEPRARTAAAAGGCILVRRAVLDAAGGIDAIRGALIDDVALARGVKAAGGRIWLGLDPEMVSLRGYGSLAEVTRMVSRTAFHQLGYRYSVLAGTIAFLGLLFVAPPALALLGAVLGDRVAAACGALAWALQTALFLPAVRHHRVRAAYALTLPIASALYAWMTCVSAWRHLRGRGVEWKGRRVSGLRASGPTEPATPPPARPGP